jgi:endonuclease III-like uncharacterized protein
MSSCQRSTAAQHYNDLHGLIVRTGKEHCRKAVALCDGCPLQPFLPRGGPRELPGEARKSAAIIK